MTFKRRGIANSVWSSSIATFAADHGGQRQSECYWNLSLLATVPSPRSNAVDSVRMPSTTFKGYSNLALLDLCSHACKRRVTLERCRRHSTVCDHRWPWWQHQFERYRNLLMLNFWYRPVPCVWMPSTALECLRRLSAAFKCVRRRQWERYI